MSKSNIGIIVLAAGASTRMGEPKQLLRFQGETLLRRSVNAALKSVCQPVIVVLGAQADLLRNELTDTTAEIVFNQQWEEGMSASIRCGILALEARTDEKTEAAIITLCDQPFVTVDIINNLVETFHAAKNAKIVASEYEETGKKTYGVPALFSRSLFSELMALQGTEGAKRVINRNENDAVFIPVSGAIFDIDTLDDYKALQDYKK